VCPIDVLWNFSAVAGSVPPFLVGSVVDQPGVQVMTLAVGVYTDFHRSRMTMGSVTNIYGINMDDDPWNPPVRMSPFELFPSF